MRTLITIGNIAEAIIWTGGLIFLIGSFVIGHFKAWRRQRRAWRR